MRTTGRNTIAIAAAAWLAASLAGAASAGHNPPAGQAGPPPTRAVLNGVVNAGKTSYARWNFRFHVSRAGAVTGTGSFNGGHRTYFQLTQVDSLACTAATITVVAEGTLNGGGKPVKATISGVNGGSPATSSLTISWPKFSATGSPLDAGKVQITNCRTG